MNKLILIALFAFLFAGCTKKNTPAPGPINTSATITGKWYFKTDTVREYQNGVLKSMDTLSFNHTDYIQFNQDESGVMTSFGVPASFTYTYSGGIITISVSQKANDGTPLAPLIETSMVKVLTTNSLIMDNVINFTFGAGTTFKETANESFEK